MSSGRICVLCLCGWLIDVILVDRIVVDSDAPALADAPGPDLSAAVDKALSLVTITCPVLHGGSSSTD